MKKKQPAVVDDKNKKRRFLELDTRPGVYAPDGTELKPEMLILSYDDKIYKFIKDERIKKIDHLKNNMRASEEAIRRYFQKKSKEPYNPVSQYEFNKNILLKYRKEKEAKHYRVVKKHKTRPTELIRTNKRYTGQFNYMYIRVKVKIHLDGYYVFALGRGDYYYSSEYPNGIPKEAEVMELDKAVKRALAPYGSGLSFSIVNWSYVYNR